MSGSIFGNRIKTFQVQHTINQYILDVLSKFSNDDFEYVSCVPTGSYVRYHRENKIKPDGHGDIDLIVYIRIKNNKYAISDLRKEFKQFLDKQSNNTTVPFKDGKNKGSKSQLFGSIVTCGYPIVTDLGQDITNYVQIDNMIVDSVEELDFQRNFFNLSVQTQATLQGIMRCLLWENEYKNQNCIPLSQLEYNLSYKNIKLNSVLYTNDLNWEEDKKQRKTVFVSNNWNYMMNIIKKSDITIYHYINEDNYTDLINYIKHVYSNRSKQRIVGVIKSMIRIGENEKNIMKGTDKLNFLKYVNTELLDF